jgi:hypothetical protein
MPGEGRSDPLREKRRTSSEGEQGLTEKNKKLKGSIPKESSVTQPRKKEAQTMKTPKERNRRGHGGHHA